MSQNIKIRAGELIEFPSKDKMLLQGFLMRPKNSRTCIIYIHGMGGNFCSSNLPFSLADKVKKNGISVFTINTRGHDSVAKIRTGKKISFIAGTSIEKFKDCMYDIGGAISALKNLGFKSFILAGHSTGCQKITYYQHKKQNKSVKALVLLAPGDDYNINKRHLGRKFGKVVEMCKKLVKNGLGNEPNREIPSHFSPNRFLSVSDLKNIEARLFNYDGKLAEFGKIRTPMCVLFGSREEYAIKPAATYLKILQGRTKSMAFSTKIIKGAKHSFRNHEDETSIFVSNWLHKMKTS